MLKRKEMLAAILEEYGIDSESQDEQMESWVCDSVVPGCCKYCGAIEDSCEPDATENHCGNCGENGVKSVLIIAGLC